MDVRSDAARRDPDFAVSQFRRADSLAEPGREMAFLLLQKQPDFAPPNDFSEKTQPAFLRAETLFFGPDAAKNLAAFWPFFPQKWQSVVERFWQKRLADEGWTNHARLLNFRDSVFDRLLRYDATLEQFLLFEANYPEAFPSSFAMEFALLELEAGDEKLLAALLAALQNDAEKGQVSQTVLNILAQQKDERGWQALRDLLVAAQRQDGIRTAVLQSLRHGQKGAILLVLEAVLAENLLRFQSVVNGVGQLFELNWYGTVDEKTAILHVQRAVEFFKNTAALDEKLASENLAELHFALQFLKRSDRQKLKTKLLELLENGPDERREMAFSMIHWGAGFTPEEVENWVVRLLDSSDLRLRSAAMNRLGQDFWKRRATELFPKMIRFLEDMPVPDPPRIETGASWRRMTAPMSDHGFYYGLLMCEQSAMPVRAFLPFVERASASQKGQILRLLFPSLMPFLDAQRVEKSIPNLTARPTDFAPTAEDRALLFQFLMDKNAGVVAAAARFYQFFEANEAETAAILKLLDRKTGDVRQSAIAAVLAFSDEKLVAATEKILRAGNEEARTAGLDVLLQLKKSGRLAPFVKTSATTFSERKNIGPKEDALLQNLLDEAAEYHDNDAGYGLFDPKNGLRDGVLKPAADRFFAQKMLGKPDMGLSVTREKLLAELKKLDDLIVSKKGIEYEHDNGESKRTIIFGADAWFTPLFYPYNRDRDSSPEANFRCFPFDDVWEKWFRESGLTAVDLLILRFNDGQQSFQKKPENWWPDWANGLIRPFSTDLGHFVFSKNAGLFSYSNYFQHSLLPALEAFFAGADHRQIQLDWTEHFFASVPPELRFRIETDSKTGMDFRLADQFRAFYSWLPALTWTGEKFDLQPPYTDSDFEQYWRLASWLCFDPKKPFYNSQFLPSMTVIADARRLDLISDDAVFEYIFEAPGQAMYALGGGPSNLFSRAVFEHWPFLKPIFERAKSRILDIELKRGDTETRVSNHASQLQWLEGSDFFIKILKGLGSDTLLRGYSWGNSSKKVVFSKLLKVCFPSAEDSLAAFSAKLKAEKLAEKRLIEAAIYAPQWLDLVADFLGWAGLKSMAWWLHAHTNDLMDAQKEGETARFSPISAQDFKDGAADAAWFREAFSELGAERFEVMYDAAKYVCDGTGHARARLYADAILGKLTLEDAQKRVAEKRNKDNVVALGLIVLDKKAQQTDLLARYKMLAAFKKDSREFGALRQASEALAVRIALDNLARTAGFPDPQRLIWAMETLDAQAMMTAAAPVVLGETTVALETDALGKTDFLVTKNGKRLADLPAALKKEPSILALRETKNALNEQRGRIRKGLEEAMLRGDFFEWEELEKLAQHPVIRPMIAALVFVFESKKGQKAGFFVENDRENGLKTASGELFKIEKKERLPLAHAVDLRVSGDWAALQKLAFSKKIVQPFKQIFRELYLPTDDEKTATQTERWAGHRIQKTQAAALLKTRGWSVAEYVGMQKVFHAENLVARLHAEADWFNAGNPETPVLQEIRFEKRRSGEAVRLGEVPERLFSEAMRDVDLIVSVANVGGVDLEASLSTLDFRRVLVAETAELFGLLNVEIKEKSVLIAGKLGQYAIHLGSGTASKMPGGALALAASTAAERGRIFLPFADDDPRTAEILSKILLLARDSEIKDPTVLGQLLRV